MQWHEFAWRTGLQPFLFTLMSTRCIFIYVEGVVDTALFIDSETPHHHAYPRTLTPVRLMTHGFPIHIYNPRGPSAGESFQPQEGQAQKYFINV